MENVKVVMEFIVNNIALIIAFICVIIVAIERIVEFIGLPTDKKVAQVKKILLSWVVEAETKLGDGTGAIKLSDVYAKFVAAYPYMAKWVSEEQFGVWVDEALKTVEEKLKPAAYARIMNK